MESIELELNRDMRMVRNYGLFVFVSLFILSAAAVGVVDVLEKNDIRNELAVLSEKLPPAGSQQVEQNINLPEDILSLHANSIERRGFYETRIVDRDYLAYANPAKNYILMKSEEEVQHETLNFALALLALYVGNIVILLGWWFFVRAKVREIFEVR